MPECNYLLFSLDPLGVIYSSMSVHSIAIKLFPLGHSVGEQQDRWGRRPAPRYRRSLEQFSTASMQWDWVGATDLFLARLGSGKYYSKLVWAAWGQ